MIPHLQENLHDAMENPVVARLAPNSKGRDFVCGDLHGSFPSVEEFLQEVNFNTSRDRLLCVGDLTNRGPESLRCLKLLEEPWFHCVLGNHDENTINALTQHFAKEPDVLLKKETWEFLAINGGIWLVKEATSEHNKPLLLNALKSLLKVPRILIVGEGKTRFHLVHASLLKGTGEEIHTLSDERIDKALQNIKPFKHPQIFNEARPLARMILENLKENPALNDQFKTAENLSRTFCGHTSLPHPIQLLSHMHMDTGAGKPDREGKIRWLSCLEVNEPKAKVMRFRAGHPRLKIKTKKAVKEAVKANKAQHPSSSKDDIKP